MDLPVVTIDLVDFLSFAGYSDQKRTCQYNSWCFGQTFFQKQNVFPYALGKKQDGEIVDSLEFHLIAPGWVCDHCGEIEPIKGFEAVARLKVLYYLEQHRGQPDLPGFEQPSGLVLYYSQESSF